MSRLIPYLSAEAVFHLLLETRRGSGSRRQIHYGLSLQDRALRRRREGCLLSPAPTAHAKPVRRALEMSWELQRAGLNSQRLHPIDFSGWQQHKTPQHSLVWCSIDPPQLHSTLKTPFNDHGVSTVTEPVCPGGNPAKAAPAVGFDFCLSCMPGDCAGFHYRIPGSHQQRPRKSQWISLSAHDALLLTIHSTCRGFKNFPSLKIWRTTRGKNN